MVTILMGKAKAKKVEIVTTKTGERKVKIGKKTYKLPNVDNLTERQLIKYLVQKITRRRRRKNKNAKGKQQAFKDPNPAHQIRITDGPVQQAESFAGYINALQKQRGIEAPKAVEPPRPRDVPLLQGPDINNFIATEPIQYGDQNVQFYVHKDNAGAFEQMKKGYESTLTSAQKHKQKADIAEAQQRKLEIQQKRLSEQASQAAATAKEELLKSAAQSKQVALKRAKVIISSSKVKDNLRAALKTGSIKLPKDSSNSYETIFKFAHDKLPTKFNDELQPIIKLLNSKDPKDPSYLPVSLSTRDILGLYVKDVPASPKKADKPPATAAKEHAPTRATSGASSTSSTPESGPVQEPIDPVLAEKPPPAKPVASSQIQSLTESLLQSDQGGVGILDARGQGLTSDEIDHIMKKYPQYLGTIAHNEIKYLLPRVKGKREIGFIINTDPDTKAGQHWTAIYANNESVEYYDSFARPMPDDLRKDLELLLDMMPDTGYRKFKENKIISQKTTSVNCGWFCLKFLIDRFRGKPFADVSGFNDAARGEKDIEEFKKKYASFGYI
jgi:hypothetical protein